MTAYLVDFPVVLRFIGLARFFECLRLDCL